MSRPGHSRHGIGAIAACLLAVVVASGCGPIGRSPGATPADFGGIAGRLARLGIDVRDIVSGDPGCPGSSLSPMAISFTASGLDQPTPVRIHLYIFRNQDAFGRLRPDVDLCARSYVSDPATYSSVEASPYVAAGQGPWGHDFDAALQTGLTDAAKEGG